MAGNKITRKEVVEDKVLSIGPDYAKALQPAIDANERWLNSFGPIKAAALEYANIEKQFKVADGRKEFLSIKQQEEILRRKAAEAIKAEQSALVAKQKVEQSVIDTEKKTLLLATQKERAQRQTVKLSAQERLELQILNRGKREAAVISSKLSTEYERQSVILTQLRRKYKDLALTEGTSGKAAKALRNDIQRLDASLKKVDAQVGQFQRNVGNYTKAMQNARAAARQLASALGVVGGAFLVVQVLRDAIKVVRDFEKANATLSAILQVEKRDMQELTQDAIRLGESTVKTAGQVTELQIAYARLGFSQSQILDLTEATISGSIAMNAELDRTANLTGAVVNTFDDLSTTDAPRILDIMSLATAKSALNFDKLETGIPIVAGAANAAGIPFTKLVALMGKLADSGIDVSTSSTALRNIFIESAAQGLNYGEILEKIKNSQDKLTASNDEFGKRSAVSAAVLANNIDKTNELDEALNNAAGTAERMANKELDTLDGSIKLLRSAWEGYILRLDESTESSVNLKNIIGFVAENLDKILGIIALSVKLWIAYKVAVQTARLQAYLMNQQLALTRIQALKGAQGITIATTAWKRFTTALKANALFLIVAGIVALVAALKTLNKSASETAAELHEANEAFILQAQSTLALNEELSTMADRYDELKSKTSLNKKEQKELDDIIKKIAKNVPDAVTEVDKYGNALSINTDKVREFNKENGKIAKLQAEINIDKQKKTLKELETSLEGVNKVAEGNSSVLVKGIGVIEKVDGVLKKVTTSFTKSGKAIITYTNLTKQQELEYAKYVKSVEDGIETTKADIEANEDIIASVTGVKNARQEEADASKKAADDAAALAVQKEEEILIVKQLRAEIASQEQILKDLTKNGYENLTKAQADNIVKTRESIAEKQKELNAILGITKANKDAQKAEKERLAAEKKLITDAFNLRAFSLNQRINEQKDIAENEKKSFADRNKALAVQAELELELARITAENKLQEIEGFKQKEIDQLLSQNDLTLKQTKKLTDEQLLIFREFQAKKKEIQSGKEDSEDALEVDRIKSEAETLKAIKEKQLNDELALENELFLKKEGIYAIAENAVEERERRIADIKKKYALEALETQIDALDKLVKQTEEGTELRAKYEADLAEYQRQLSDLKTEDFIENNEREVRAEFEKVERILELSDRLAGALSDLTNAIFDARIQKIDEEIEASDAKYERLLENELISEEQRKAIQDRQELDRKKLEKKRSDEQRKQAVLAKVTTAFSIALSTASAIISALAAPPIGLGPVAGIPLSIAAGALGAIQLAAALAAPIPKYVKGTDFHPGGPAEVAEVRPEVIHEPNKKPYVISQPTILDLPRGTKVTPSLEEYEQMMRASILASVDIDNKKLNTFQAKVLVNNNYDALIKEMQLTREAIKKQPKQPIHFHERNIDINHAVWAAKNIKWHG